jgi:multiple sugar transport system permease protein
MTATARPNSLAADLPDRRPRRARWRVSRGLPIAYAILLGLAAFCVLPFGWVVLAAVDPHAGLYLALPAELSLANFARFFADPSFVRLLLNSMIYSGGATVVVTVCSVLGGYVLSRYAFPGRRTLMFGILLTRIIPVTATIAPLYIIALRLQLADTYHGLILILAAQQLPLALWILKGFFDTIPAELEEAAWIDGAGRLGSALRIVLPLALPGVTAAALFTFIETWGDFLTPLILIQSPEQFPLSIGLFRAFSGRNIVDWGLLTSVSVIYITPSLIFYLLVRRYLVRATVAGALHG